MKARICAQLALVTALGISGAAQAALHSREPFMIYDDVLDITWQAGGYGYVFWQDAITFAANDTHGGFYSWRLPTISELSSLYYVGLGNSGCSPNSYTPVGCGLVDDPANPNDENLFVNLLNHTIWSSAQLNADYAYAFDMTRGITESAYKQGNGVVAFHVIDGDVAAVPEADTWAMLLAGLGLVGVAARRRKLARV